MLRVLVIGEAEKEAAAKLVAFATKPENFYSPFAKQNADAVVKIPGNDPNHVLQLGDYRCVFTITITPSGKFRHLSISVPAEDKLPNPHAVMEIAKLFGIQGTLQELAQKGHIGPNEHEHCVVLGEEYEP